MDTTIRTRTTKMTAIPYDQYTKEHCEKWLANPTVNPVTGKTIRRDTVARPNVFDRITQACAKHGIRLPDNAIVAAPVTQGTLRTQAMARNANRTPPKKPNAEQKKIMKQQQHNIPFPKSLDDWEKLYRDVKGVINRVERVEPPFIVQSDRNLIETFSNYRSSAFDANIFDLYLNQQESDKFLKKTRDMETDIFMIMKNVPILTVSDPKQR